MSKRMGQKGPRPTIAITSEIIAFSERNNSSHCMTAAAIEQQCEWAKRIAVDIQTIRFTDIRTGMRCVYLTPRVVQEAIIDFDDGVHVRPFSVRLTGAMLTPAGRRRDRTKPETPRKATIELGNRDSKHRYKPEVMGGRPPPRSGLRREFGLRGFRRAASQDSREHQTE